MDNLHEIIYMKFYGNLGSDSKFEIVSLAYFFFIIKIYILITFSARV